MSELHKKFGELLKLERQRKGIKLEELAEQLKISETNLEHIENGEVSSLPSLIYFNLFAKSFAEALGIDFERTVDAIKEDLGETIDEEETPPKGVPAARKPKKRPDKPKKDESEGEDSSISIKKLLYLFIAIVTVFVVFLAVYMIFFRSESLDSTGTVAPAEVIEANKRETDETTTDAEASGFDWNVPEYEEPRLMKLRLVSRNESWSTVVADGDTVIFRNLIPGRVYEAEAMYRLIVSIGIPSQVDVQLNDQAVDLRDPESGRVSRVEINQLNLEEILSGPQELQTDDRSQPLLEPSSGAVPPSENDTTDLEDTTGGPDSDGNGDG